MYISAGLHSILLIYGYELWMVQLYFYFEGLYNKPISLVDKLTSNDSYIIVLGIVGSVIFISVAVLLFWLVLLNMQ